MAMSQASIGTVDERTFDCGCEATLFGESAVVAVKPCGEHTDRLTAIK